MNTRTNEANRYRSYSTRDVLNSMATLYPHRRMVFAPNPEPVDVCLDIYDEVDGAVADSTPATTAEPTWLGRIWAALTGRSAGPRIAH